MHWKQYCVKIFQQCIFNKTFGTFEIALEAYAHVEVAQNIAKSTFHFITSEFFMNGKLNCVNYDTEYEPAPFDKRGLWWSWSTKNWNFNWKFNLAVFSAKMEVCVSEKTGQGDSGEWCLNNKQCWEVLGKNWQIELLVAVAKFCRGSTIDNWQVHLRWHWCHQCLPMSTPSLSSSSSSSSFSS